MAQIGNNNAGKGSTWRNMLKERLKKYDKKGCKRGRALERIADKVIADAIDGNKDAWNEIAVRLDGKPSQEITGIDNTNITLVQRVIIQQVIEDQADDAVSDAIDGECVEYAELLPVVTVPPPLPSMVKRK